MQEEIDKGVAGLSLIVVVIIRSGLVCLFNSADFGAKSGVLSFDLDPLGLGFGAYGFG